MKTMETECVSCKKKTANKHATVGRTRQNRLILVLNCAFCCKTKSTFIKNQDANGLLIKLGIKTPLTNILLIGNALF